MANGNATPARTRVARKAERIGGVDVRTQLHRQTRLVVLSLLDEAHITVASTSQKASHTTAQTNASVFSMMRVQQLVARAAAVAAAQTPRIALRARTPHTHLPLQLVAGFTSRSNSSNSSSSSSSGRKKPPTSFAIAEAFDGLDDNDDNGDNDDNDDNDSTSDTRRHRKSDNNDATREFHAAMAKKKLWLQSLAHQRQFAHIVKAVDDCYAPLYALPAAASLRPTRALLTTHFDATRVATKFQPTRFSDTLARTTEQEALALLVIAREGTLARAVFAHRRALATALVDTPLVLTTDRDSDAIPLDLTRHFRSFYSWGMGAYSLSNDYDMVFHLYHDALAAAVYPTASMHATYVKALVSARRPAADVTAFYRDVTREQKPTNVFFFRELLFFASVQHDTGLLLELLDAMKVKGFKLRAADYVLAIKAFDDQYFLVPRTAPITSRRIRETKTAGSPKSRLAGSHSVDTPANQLTTPLDTYATCVARIAAQDATPDAFDALDAAAHSVLALFDEMVDDERLAPTNAELYPRVIAAAVYAREYPKAMAAVELFETHVRKGHTEFKSLHPVGVRMAVNALLLLNEPERAWAFTQSMCGKFHEPRDFAHVANIIEYLSRADPKTSASLLLAILQDAATLHLLPRFSNATVKVLLPALVRCDPATLSDDDLYTTVSKYEEVFHIQHKAHAFTQFVNECAFRKRVQAAKIALQRSDPTVVGKLKMRLSLRLAAAFEDASDDDAVVELLDATDIRAAAPADVAALTFAVMRALKRLGRSRDESQRVYATHVAPLVATGKVSSDAVPADVAAIVQAAA